MVSTRQIFLNNVAQTSEFPMGLEIEKASGVYLHDTNGKKYIDLISGIGVSNVGHCHPNVVEAVQNQAATYMHVMVYGEYIQSPQSKLAAALVNLLPESLNNVYFVNSGSEAIEGALKLAKRYTGRSEIIHFEKAYHGSSHGALSVGGDEIYKQNYRPLLPDIKQIEYNNLNHLKSITNKTACVVAEVVKAEAGIVLAKGDYLTQLRNRCTEVGALLIFDEIQTGFGRTGSFFAFEQYQVVPDIITLAKGMGGGMPIGAFIANKEMMHVFTNQPILGHITTFGGNAVTCAASLATLEVIINENLLATVQQKEALFHQLLTHTAIKEIRSKGLIMALQLDNFENNKKVIDNCVRNGVITDWFLFADDCLRIAPPLTITLEEIKSACIIINQSLNEVYG